MHLKMFWFFFNQVFRHAPAINPFDNRNMVIWEYTFMTHVVSFRFWEGSLVIGSLNVSNLYRFSSVTDSLIPTEKYMFRQVVFWNNTSDVLQYSEALITWESFVSYIHRYCYHMMQPTAYNLPLRWPLSIVDVSFDISECLRAHAMILKGIISLSIYSSSTFLSSYIGNNLKV